MTSKKNNKKYPVVSSKKSGKSDSDFSDFDEISNDEKEIAEINEHKKLVHKKYSKKKYAMIKIVDTSSSDSTLSDVVKDISTEEELNSKCSTDEKTPTKKIVSNKKIAKNSNEIFKELIKKQLSDVPSQWKLNINDMKRICKYIDTSIFDNKNCCIWKGYITNMNNSNKGTYVNFYFRNKKVALHRLLYSNFVAPLDSSEYLKFNCDNKGICCNINHYEKYKYSKNNIPIKKEQKLKEHKKEIKEIVIIGTEDPDKLIVDFD